MIGMDRRTGKFISGDEHLEQSMEVLFTTSIGSRVMRRDLGIDTSLVDRPADRLSLGLWAYVLADGLDRAKDKRFKIDRVDIESVDSEGKVHLKVYGQNTESLETIMNFAI